MIGIPAVRRGIAVALADLPGLHVPARRTSVVRIVLAAALLATLAWLFIVARSADSISRRVRS